MLKGSELIWARLLACAMTGERAALSDKQKLPSQPGYHAFFFHIVSVFSVIEIKGQFQCSCLRFPAFSGKEMGGREEIFFECYFSLFLPLSFQDKYNWACQQHLVKHFEKIVESCLEFSFCSARRYMKIPIWGCDPNILHEAILEIHSESFISIGSKTTRAVWCGQRDGIIWGVCVCAHVSEIGNVQLHPMLWQSLSFSLSLSLFPLFLAQSGKIIGTDSQDQKTPLFFFFFPWSFRMRAHARSRTRTHIDVWTVRLARVCLG